MSDISTFWRSILFENPEFIWWRNPVSIGALMLVGAILVTTLVWWRWHRSRVQAIKDYGTIGLVTRWTEMPAMWTSGLALAGLVATLVLFQTAATMPYQSMGAVSVPSGSLRVVALFDASRSLGAEDRDSPPLFGGTSCTLKEGPCGRRIEIARLLLLNQIMPVIKGNQLGVVTFAGSPVTKSALTDDYTPIETMLTTGWIDVGTAMGEGTYLADGLNAALKVLQKNPAKSGESDVILLFTDGGENHNKAEELQASIEAIRKSGTRLIVIGVGSTKPALIPLYTTAGKPIFLDDGKRSYHKMADGSIAETARSDEFLGQLARDSGGSYFPVDGATTLHIDWPTSLAGSKVEIAKRYLYAPLVGVAMGIIAAIWFVGPFVNLLLNLFGAGAASRRRNERG